MQRADYSHQQPFINSGMSAIFSPFEKQSVMLYYKFRNFEEFKELFGIQHHGNGEKSRKNKILLSYIKDRNLLHKATTTGDYHLLHISSMAELKQTMFAEILRSGDNDGNLPYRVCIFDNIYWSATYRTDDYKGVCEDGDYNAIRYVNTENGRVFKMKIGKFYRKLILETEFGRTLPDKVITYLCEEITQDWQTYTMNCLPQHRLHVGTEFGKIYDSDECVGDFHSCMTDKGYHTFYENAVDAKAAYLENEDEQIIARCVIYMAAKDQHGKIWRLAERQYASNGDNILKRALVDALVKGGHIDGYKTVGAGCSDSQAFVANDGTSLSGHDFSISCDLDFGDTLSYQDSFKHYDEYTRIATNFGKGDYELDTSDGIFGDDDDGEYDSYHDRHCNEVRTVYRHGHEYTCDCEDMGDFRWVERDQEYHHEDDVFCCERCNEYVLTDDSHFSEMTEEYYCCESCMENAEQEYKETNWTYSDYDEEYYEDADDVVEYRYWNPGTNTYERRTISTASLEEQVESGDFHSFEGVAYDEIDDNTGLPYGMYLASKSMAEAA